MRWQEDNNQNITETSFCNVLCNALCGVQIKDEKS